MKPVFWALLAIGGIYIYSRLNHAPAPSTGDQSGGNSVFNNLFGGTSIENSLGDNSGEEINQGAVSSLFGDANSSTVDGGLTGSNAGDSTDIYGNQISGSSDIVPSPTSSQPDSSQFSDVQGGIIYGILGGLF